MACDEAQAGKRESTAGGRRQRAYPRCLPKWYSERSSAVAHPAAARRRCCPTPTRRQRCRDRQGTSRI